MRTGARAGRTHRATWSNAASLLRQERTTRGWPQAPRWCSEKVSPAFTSQRCSACGHVAAESRKNQALFACVACGFVVNADVNAAKNIAAGYAVTARGGDGVARPVNREPRLLLLPA